MGSNLSLFKTPACNPASNSLSSCDLDTDTNKNCIQSVHTKMERIIGMESLPFPDEIVLKILGYLNFGQLIQCARVSKRWKNICEDRSLSYRSSMLVMKKLNCSKQNWVSSFFCKNSTSLLHLFHDFLEFILILGMTI